MKVDYSDLLPPSRLAIVYARGDLRDAFALLLLLDERLAGVVSRSTEPLIAQMKLAWWRESLLAAPEKRPKGEPIFEQLREIGLSDPVPALQKLVDAWGMLLAEDEWTAPIVHEFAAARSDAVFGSYAEWAGFTGDILTIGRQWVVNDMVQRFGDRVPDTATFANPEAARSVPRALSILALSAKQPTGARMLWHALTGR